MSGDHPNVHPGFTMATYQHLVPDVSADAAARFAGACRSVRSGDSVDLALEVKRILNPLKADLLLDSLDVESGTVRSPTSTGLLILLRTSASEHAR